MPIEIQFEKRIVNKVVREADARSHRDYLIVTVLAGMFLLGLFAYGWQHYQYIQYGYRLEDAQKKKEQLAEVGRQLRLERASLRNLQRIDAIARGELGMVVPVAGQVLILRADSPLTIPTPQQERPGEAPAEMAAKRF